MKRGSRSFILKTKLALPVLKENVISRPHLLSLLKENLSKKLILIVADAGYGKTTLLTQLIKDQKLPYVFYDLDKGDNDFAVFLSYLVYSLEQLQPGLIMRTKGLLAQGGEAISNYELMMGTLINELVEKRKQELFFILDDYHALAEDSMVHKAVDYFIDHFPEAMHVIVASRTIPSLPSMAKWRAKQNLFEISREALKFTEDEVKALLAETHKIALSEEELRNITAHTEGWITGIQLILQTAGKDSKPVKETLNGYLEANQPLFDYFANEIFNSETKETQEFLMKSAVFDILMPDACNRIIGIKNSEKMLKDLVKCCLFLSLVGKDEYKYHWLFHEFLKNQIKDDELLQNLHLKTANYFQEKKQMELAIKHYLEAKKYDKAGKLIIQLKEEIWQKALFSTLADWLLKIPEEFFEKEPQLLATRAWLYRVKGDIEKAEGMLDQTIYYLKQKPYRRQTNTRVVMDVMIERSRLLWKKGEKNKALTTLHKALQTCPSSEKIAKLQILNLLGVIYGELGNFTKAECYMKKAKKVVNKSVPPLELTFLESHLVMIYCRKGDIRLSFEMWKPLIERLKEKYTYAIGLYFYNSAKTALDAGEVEWAEQLLQQGIELCRPYEDAWSSVALHRGLAYLYMLKAQWDEACQYEEKALEEVRKLGWLGSETLIFQELSRIYRYQGELAKAKEYLDRITQKISDIEIYLGANLLIEKGLLEVYLGQFDKAQRTIKMGLKVAQRLGWKTGEFLVRLGLSEINSARGKDKQAIRFLSDAVCLSQLKGYDGILICELRSNQHLRNVAQDMLIKSRKISPIVEYIRDILRRCDIPVPTVIGEPRLKVQLFGKFDLLVNELSRSFFMKRRTTRAILAYFILHPGSNFTWENITSWVWPESPDRTAHQMFKIALWEIRRSTPALKSIIHYHAGHYCLNENVEVWFDVWEFKKFLQLASENLELERKEELLKKAGVLYRGPLLPDFYYNWLIDLRYTIEMGYTKELISLAKALAEKKEFVKSIYYCLKSLEVDELNEEAHRLLISNYIDLGLKAKALRHYNHLRKLFRKNLKIEPSLETTSLVKTLS